MLPPRDSGALRNHLGVQPRISRKRDVLWLGRSVHDHFPLLVLSPVQPYRLRQHPFAPFGSDPMSEVNQFTRFTRGSPLELSLATEELVVRILAPLYDHALVAHLEKWLEPQYPDHPADRQRGTPQLVIVHLKVTLQPGPVDPPAQLIQRLLRIQHRCQIRHQKITLLFRSALFWLHFSSKCSDAKSYVSFNQLHIFLRVD